MTDINELCNEMISDAGQLAWRIRKKPSPENCNPVIKSLRTKITRLEKFINQMERS